MTASATGWRRTLGNYACDSRAARPNARPLFTSRYTQRQTSVAFKLPRLPNPKVALLSRLLARATGSMTATDFIPAMSGRRGAADAELRSAKESDRAAADNIAQMQRRGFG